MNKRAEAKPRQTAGAAATLAEELKTFRAQLETIAERGRIVAAHIEHLDRTESFVRESWAKEDVSHCPTCGTNHAQDGGILKALAAVRAETQKQREVLRADYTVVKSQMEAVQKQLGELGQAQAPLTSHEQLTLVETLRWLAPPEAAFEEWIENSNRREALLQQLSALRHIPTAPSAVDVESEATSIAGSILSKFEEAKETFEAPDNWKPVKDKLTEILAEIVTKHLPTTLENLWRELTLTLTTAPWLLPERPCIPVASDRKGRKPSVRVKGRLARYILNQAELHVLGLAWFFARYLTHGRFHHSALVMDDPAHELDQTSFRELCRLWETLIRLHRVYRLPLTLVVLLNQESRAVEAARATGGILSVLGWARAQDEPVQATNVIGTGFYPPHPAMLFEEPV